MNVLFVIAHPEPKSFNHALLTAGSAALLGAGHAVQISDLYAQGFNPVSGRHNFTTIKDATVFRQQQEEQHASEHDGFASDVQAELDKLAWCDLLVLQFPLWWFGLPAILKGWVDRVFVMGRVYGGGKWYDRGAFAGKRALCSVTIGGPASMYAPDGLNGDIEQILFPIQHGMLYFTGFAPLPAHRVHGPVRMTPAEREQVLIAWAERLLRIEAETPLAYPPLAAYDEAFRLKR